MNATLPPRFFLTGMILLGCLFNVVFAQQTVVVEKDLPFEFIKWHYHYYPNATTNKWTRTALNEEVLYIAEFTFEEKEYVTMYKESGVREQERITLDEDELAPLIFNHLEDSYDKYKVVSYAQINEFTDKYTAVTKYQLEVKTGNGTEILWYDKYHMHLDPNQLASNK